ncbi:MAG: hypothetical protein H7Y20_19110 [Bryobacteraceae bacterium]|nr:hypothetical protein [Bryobacteraceae bacterium]
MISRRSLLIAGTAPLAACRRKRGEGFNGYAFVANEEGRAVAAVDLTAFAVARHIRLDDAPSQVLAHTTTGFVYCLTPARGVIYEIDSGTLAIRRKLALRAPATRMILEPGGRVIWVLSASSRRLLRVDLEPLRVSDTIALPPQPTGFDLSEYTGLAAVVHGLAGSVSFIDLAKGHVGATVQLRGQLGAIRFQSDGKALLVANTEARQLTVLDSLKAAVVVHLPLSIRPDHFCFHPNGGQLFITGEGRDAVVIVYPYYVPEVAETVLAGSRPGAMEATDNHLFVTNPGAGDVSILNISRRRLIAVASVGADPGFVKVTPDGQYALVLNRTSGDMAVIRIAGLQPDRRKSAALFNLIPVGSKPVDAVVVSV